MTLTEKEVENSILQYLSLLKNCMAWKNQSIGIYDPIKKIFRRSNNKYHINGVSDILGIYKGRALAIEVKSKTGRATEAQVEFLTQFEAMGGVAILARSVADVVVALGKL